MGEEYDANSDRSVPGTCEYIMRVTRAFTERDGRVARKWPRKKKLKFETLD